MAEEDQEQNPLERIDNEGERLISFTKRRNSIYKNASEISILCNTDIGILIFSPSGKPFSFGSPHMEAIANRFFRRDDPAAQNDPMANLVEAQRRASIEESNRTHDELAAQLYHLRKEGERLAKARVAIEDECWWEAPLEELTPQELEHLTQAMELLKVAALRKEQELLARNPPPPPSNNQTTQQ